MSELKKGPSNIHIPAQNITTCIGCCYHKSEVMKTGKDPITSYYCKHPDTKEMNVSTVSVFGKFIGNDSSTPKWCPVWVANYPKPDFAKGTDFNVERPLLDGSWKAPFRRTGDYAEKLKIKESQEEKLINSVSQQIQSVANAEGKRIDCGMMWTGEALESQVERLALYILSNHKGYPKDNEGAIDTAISIMEDLKPAKEFIKKAYSTKEIDDYVANLIINKNISKVQKLGTFDYFVKERVNTQVVGLLEHAEKARLILEQIF